MENIIAEEVVRLLGQQPAEFLGTLKTENGDWKPEDEIKSAVNNLYSNRLKQVVDEQKGRAVRERMTTAEKFIKEKWGIESGESLEDRIAKLAETIEAKGGKEKIVEKKIELDEEGVKKHPAFEKLLKTEVVQRLSAVEKERDEWREKHTNYVQQQEERRLYSAVNGETATVLETIKAALDKDPSTRKKQVNMFVAGLRSQYRFKLDDNGKPYPVNEKGEPMEDDSFSRITFADLVKKENIFGVHQYDPDKNSPSPSSQPSGTPPAKYTGAVPKDNASFMAALRKEPDPAKKEALKVAYKQQIEAAQKAG